MDRDDLALAPRWPANARRDGGGSNHDAIAKAEAGASARDGRRRGGSRRVVRRVRRRPAAAALARRRRRNGRRALRAAPPVPAQHVLRPHRLLVPIRVADVHLASPAVDGEDDAAEDARLRVGPQGAHFVAEGGQRAFGVAADDVGEAERFRNAHRGVAPRERVVLPFHEGVKDVRGSESNCEHDSREM
jgi:hypothetical protein